MVHKIKILFCAALKFQGIKVPGVILLHFVRPVKKKLAKSQKASKEQ